MKKIVSILAATTILIASCNNDKKAGEVTVKSEDGKSTATIDVNDAAKNMESMQKKSEDLQKLAPYTLDQMKAMIPEELAGAKRTNFNATTAMGTSFAKGDYKINDSTDIELNIYDCAGQAGAGIYTMQYYALMNLQSESDDESTRTVDYKGGKAIENIRKDGSRATFTWFAADRLLVSLQGDHTGIDVLRQAASNLTLK